MPVSGPARSAQGRLGAAIRWKHPDADDARREHVTAKIADYIERSLADAPTLTAEQRSRIAAALQPYRGGGDRAGAA